MTLRIICYNINVPPVGLNVFSVFSCSITAERSVTENVGNKETKTSGGCFTTPPSGVMFNSSEVAVVDTKVK